MWGITAAQWLIIFGTVLWLVVLEGLLSADNALVLAVMVRHLPKQQRKRALRYGIWGAFILRFLAVVLAQYLLLFWQLKAVGGLYLLYLAATHLWSEVHDEPHEQKESSSRGFWLTVLNVELADIAFSIDSILAAVAMTRGLPPALQARTDLVIAIIYLGGVLGIIAMRYVAGVFLILLDRFKGLAAGAYYLVAWIGLKLVGGGLHDAFLNRALHNQGWRARVPDWIKQFPWEMHDILFWAGMAVIVLISLLYKPRARDETPPREDSGAIGAVNSPNSGSPNGLGGEAESHVDAEKPASG